LGAYSTLCALDVERLRVEVAPAVRTLLDTGERVGAIARRWQRELDETRAAEAKFVDHYAVHPKLSLELDALAAGLGIRLREHCALLDDSLAVSARSPAEMAAIVPSMHGACPSTACVVQARCPMHRTQAGPTRAEMFGSLVKAAVLGCCVDDPPDAVLGRRGTLFELSWWYEHEAGRGDDDGDTVDRFLAGTDPLVALLVALTRRGAAWGWGDGGFGEGLLGWLDVAETAALADALDAYDLAADAPASPDYDDYTRSELLPRARAMVGSIGVHARSCSARGRGVLQRRD
jgi:hypothetical protein